MPEIVSPARRTAAALLLLTAAAGCALDPGVPSPALDLPASFKATSETAAAARPSAVWWRGFGSTELDRLIRAARASNLDVAAAAARILQADAQIRVAGGALIPSLSAGAEVGRSDRGGSSGGDFTLDGRTFSTGGSSGGEDSFQATLSASYEIDFWGGNLAAYRSAAASAVFSRFDQANVALGTDAGVASTYFEVLSARRRAAIARDNLAIAGKALDVIRARRRFGTASALDEAQQETLVENVRVTIPPLEQQAEQAVNALAVLLGRPPERLTIGGGDPEALRVPPIAAGLPSELLERRPDVAQAEARLAAARLDVRTAKADLFPSITLTAEGGYRSTALRTLFDPVGQFTSIALGLTQPILDAYELRGQLDVQRGLYLESLQNYRAAVIAAFRDVDDALVAYRKTTERDALQRGAVGKARRAYRIAELQQREGILDITTLLDTQQTLFTAQDALAQAQLARLRAAVDLFQALGGGWQRPSDDAVARVR